MEKIRFRKHQIRRSCDCEFQDYHSYLPYLKNDFSCRCNYCNIHEETLGTASFQIDHFIPKKSFKGKRDQLLTQYNNLVLACPKCNRAKSDQFQGDVSKSTIENALFYNPDYTDYNDIFYRTKRGMIASDDQKGKDMIKRLKLYRNVHAYAWAIERIGCLISRLESGVKAFPEDKLASQLIELYREKNRLQKRFNTAYHQKK